MSWISIVFYILAHLPQLISIIKQVLDLVHNMPKDQRFPILRALWAAILYHKATGDASQIEAVCAGLGCAPKPVGE